MQKLSEQLRIGLQSVEQGLLREDELPECITWVLGDPKRSVREWLLNRQDNGARAAVDITEQQATLILPNPEQGESQSLRTQPWNTSVQSESPIKRPHQQPTTFQVLRKHAQGGLGVIYVARDSKLNRQVALKQIRPDRRADPFCESKFLVEAEITGQLEHPSIVPVYSMGNDEQGLPYYVMRLIHGKEMKQVIREFHDDSKIQAILFDGVQFRQLLAHFINVCYAIEYAHSRGIVHRDLKPANVMIGKHGETLVLDWGLAKPVEVDSDEKWSESTKRGPIQLQRPTENTQTQDGTFSGTIAYASPEQLEGRISSIGPASDIYSLGAILFEILTGIPSVAARPKSLTEVIEKIRIGELAQPRSINRRIPMALEMICRKAMQYEPQKRYATARELAQDMERMLADEKVIAYQNREPIPEKLGRFLRRYKSWTVPVAFSLVALTLTMMVGSSLINQARLRERSAKVREEQAKLQAVAFKDNAMDRFESARAAIETLMVGAEGLPNLPAVKDYREQLIDVAMQNYRKLTVGSSNDPELELVRIKAQIRVGDLHSALNEFEQSHQFYRDAEKAFQARTASEIEIRGDQGLNWKLEQASLLAHEAFAFQRQQKPTDAKATFQRSLGQLRELSKVFGMGKTRIALGDTLLRASEFEKQFGTMTSCAELLREGVDCYRDLPENAELQSQIAKIRMTKEFSSAISVVQASEEAVKLIDSAISQSIELFRTSKERSVGALIGELYLESAVIHRRTGRLDETITQLENANVHFEALHKQWPNNFVFAENEAQLQASLGIAHVESKNFEQAREWLMMSKENFIALRREYPTIFSMRIGLITVLDGMIQLESDGNPDDTTSLAEATSNFSDAMRLLKTWSKESPIVNKHYRVLEGTLLGHFARACRRGAEDDRTRESFTLSKEIFEELLAEYGDEQDLVFAAAEVEWQFGVFEKESNNDDQARQLFQSAEARMDKLVNLDPKNESYESRRKEIRKSKSRQPTTPKLN